MTKDDSSSSETKPPQDNGLAIASMVLGILSVTMLGPLTGIPAVIMGMLALKNPVNRGYSITGIITGAISIIVTIFIVLFFALIIFLGRSVSDGYDAGPQFTPELPSQNFRSL